MTPACFTNINIIVIKSAIYKIPPVQQTYILKITFYDNNKIF